MVASEFPTLTTRRLRPLLSVLRKRGVDVDALLAQWGTDESELLNPLHRMPRSQVLNLLGQLGVEHDLGELGLDTVDALQPDDLDLMGHLLASAPTLGAALELGVSYLGIVHDGVELALHVHDDEAHVQHRITGGRVQLPPIADFSMALLVRLIRDITGGAFPLLMVKLARPRPSRPARYREWFGAPVSFEAECNALHLPLSALAFVLPRANASLNAVLERQARAMLRAMPESAAKPTFVERVRSLLGEDLERGEVSAEGVAQRLRIAERTLRRRLEEAATSYRELLDDLRRERALVLAKDPRLNISQVAHQLGFAGPTSFGRAFRRWTGMMPTQYARSSRTG
jgi:AraC-like DNA-binding protein